MCRTMKNMSTATTSVRTPQATAQPVRPASAKAAVPKTAQTSPQTLSQNRVRRALRAVVGSLPVRIGITTPPSERTLRRAVHKEGVSVVPLPDADDLPETLIDLAVPHEDIG